MSRQQEHNGYLLQTCTADMSALMLVTANLTLFFSHIDPKICCNHRGADVPLFSTERMDNLPEAVAPAKPTLSS